MEFKMKQIFLINSHTQFLTSLGVISHLKIKPSEVIFIYSRNYNNNLLKPNFQIIDKSNIYKECMGIVANFRKQKRIIQDIDTLINETCELKPFKVYVPHLCFPFFQIFATNKYCTQIGLIQEAAISYPSRFTDKTLKEILYKLYNILFLPKKRIWKTFTMLVPKFLLATKEIEAYEISNFFNLLPIKRNKVKWPQLNIDYIIEKKHPIFIFDSLIEQKYVEKEIYLKYVKVLVNENTSKRIYIKFHPSQLEENKKAIKNIIYSNNTHVEIIELPADIPFEAFLLTYNNLNICGFNSSLVDFAKNLNHQVKDYRELLFESKLYRKLAK